MHSSLAGGTLMIVNEVLISSLRITLQFGLAWRKYCGRLRLCYNTTCGLAPRTRQEHVWVGTIVWCQRKVEVLVLFPRQCYASTYEQMDHPSTTPWLVKPKSFVEVPYHTSATFLLWTMAHGGLILSLVVLSQFLCQRSVKSLAIHCLVVESNGIFLSLPCYEDIMQLTFGGRWSTKGYIWYHHG